MFKNSFKIAWRNLFKNRLHSIINIIGLTVGLTAVLSIAIYLQHELSYDNFHKKKEQVYRIGIEAFRQGNKLSAGATFTPPIGPDMKSELAGIKNYTRYRTPREAYLSVDKNAIKAKEVIYADSTFFELFSFPILEGAAESALVAPYSIVLSQQTAQQLFGGEQALGRFIKLDNDEALQVTAIIADPPANSHISFNALVSFSTLYKDKRNHMGWTGGEQYMTYVELENKVSISDIERQLPDFMWRHINKKYASHNIRLDASLQPLSDIHLHHNYYSESLRSNIYVLGALTLLVLLIACINFINMTTARAGRRGKEVGVRKVLGANRASLGGQFLLEAFMLTGIAFMMSMFLLEAILPLLPSIFGKALQVPTLFKWTSIGGLFLLFIIVGLGAGSYPAFYMTNLDTLKTLKGMQIGSRKSSLRNGLVVFQFFISIVLIVSVLVVSEQVEFMQTKHLGFEKENILVVPLHGEAVQSKVKTLKATLKQRSQIINVAACSEAPGNGFAQNGYLPEGITESMLIKVVDVDDDYFDLFGLELLEGRSLSVEKPADKQAYIINEALAKTLNWESPLGKKIKRNGEKEVVGLVKDFNYASLHQPIEPLIITNQPWNNHFDYLTIKLAAGNVSEGIAACEAVWDEIVPNQALDYWFLDDELQQIYQSEQQLQEAFFWFAALSIFIAMMGILGLTSFMVEQRKKEIGIRKVLGASLVSIISTLSKDFLKLVGIAFFIAAPIAYYLMNEWLMDYTYRIELQSWFFIMAGIGATLLAALTVGIQSFKAASANPVESLKNT
jgi:putative ABC transport system permease protein